MSAEQAATPDFSRKVTLTGELVTLVPVTAAHIDELYPLLADPEVSRLTGSVHSSNASDDALLPWTREDVERIYDQWSGADDRIVWVVIDNSSDRVLGETVLLNLDIENLSCGFRIWMARGRGRGLGTEATRLTVQHGFEQQGLHRIQLEVYAFNPRARHVYEKVGFRWEGTMRDELRYDDGWVDAHLMSMLSTDWEASESCDRGVRAARGE